MTACKKLGLPAAVLALALAAGAAPAAAQDTVKVGVFPLSSSLPYWVALERGFFKEQNITAETVRLMGGPPNIAAMITNQIDAAAVLVTLEGINANLKKPGVAMYIALNGQNKTFQQDQFVARKQHPATTIQALKGAKLMTAPGPANIVAAKAVLAGVGLKEGDYTLDQLDMAQHVNVMKSGVYDGGLTLEPNASMMRKLDLVRTLETNVIAKYVLGDETAETFAAGAAVTSTFATTRPDVAKRFAAAWRKAIEFIRSNPQEARKHLAKNTLTPDDVVDDVPLLNYTMVSDLTAKQKADYQKWVDVGTRYNLLPEQVDAGKFMQAY
jgi:NitT/TauT family transport system substrate-binding protein